MESLLMYGKRRVTGHCAHLEVIWFMRLHSNAGRDVTQHDITVSFTNPSTSNKKNRLFLKVHPCRAAAKLPSCNYGKYKAYGGEEPSHTTGRRSFGMTYQALALGSKMRSQTILVLNCSTRDLAIQALKTIGPGEGRKCFVKPCD